VGSTLPISGQEVMKIRITQIDGKLPNLALMRLSYWHKAQGDEVFFTRSARRDMFEPEYDLVYGSAIFSFTRKKQDTFLRNFPEAIIGGTGSERTATVEQQLNLGRYEHFDYEIYPDYENSIGFSQRGCRLACKFCVVSKKEGKNVENDSINSIWRGDPYPKNIVLLDNDFFGQANWGGKVDEIVKGKFKVNFNQGINIRLINDAAAESLPRIKYYDVNFKNRRLYTAWDNLEDEKIFFKGAEKLVKNGIPERHLMVYMLIGFRKNETWEDIFRRFNALVDFGCMPFPMVYNNEDKELKKFQRWVVTRLYQFVKWEDYSASGGNFRKNIIPGQVDLFIR